MNQMRTVGCEVMMGDDGLSVITLFGPGKWGKAVHAWEWVKREGRFLGE